MLVVLAWLCLAADGPLPAELIQKALAAREAGKDLKFTYREDVERRQIDKDGKVTERTTETYDVIMLEGENYRKLVLVDGRPLDAKRQKQVDEELEKTRAQRKRRSWRRITRSVSLGELAELPRLFDLKLAGRETIGGRQAWRVEADPKPGYKAANKEEQEQLGARRTLWFDAETGVDILRKHTFIKATNGFQPGSVMELGFTPEGLAERISLVFELKAMAVVRARGETHYRYSNYQRFQAESKLLP